MTAEPTTRSKTLKRRPVAARSTSSDGSADQRASSSSQTRASDSPELDSPELNERRPRFRRLVRLGLSVLIVGHLLAVFLPPLAFQTRGPLGSSPSVETLLAPLRGYGQFLYIDRGYAFFAPDPGPSHLIGVAISDGSGEPREHMFPDLERQWPRLLYHRHFMLSEFLHEIHQPPGPPPELEEASPEEAEAWARARARFRRVHDSMVEHLEYKHPGKQVAIRRIEHAIPNFLEYMEDPIPLDDPRLYNVLLDRPRRPEGPPGDELPGGPPTDELPTDGLPGGPPEMLRLREEVAAP